MFGVDIDSPLSFSCVGLPNQSAKSCPTDLASQAFAHEKKHPDISS